MLNAILTYSGGRIHSTNEPADSHAPFRTASTNGQINHRQSTLGGIRHLDTMIYLSTQIPTSRRQFT